MSARVGRRKAIPTRVREAVLLDGACHYCGAWWASVVDHVRPVAGDGADAEGNLVAACDRCNSEKSNATPKDWRDRRLRQGKPWPPPNGALHLAGILGSLSETELELIDRAVRAGDRRVLDAFGVAFDAHHAGCELPLPAVKQTLLDQAALFASERDV